MTYVLVDKKDGNVFSVLGKPVECLLDGRVLRFGINHQEVLLCIGWLCDMLHPYRSAQLSQSNRRNRTYAVPLCQLTEGPSQSPKSS